MTKGTLLRRKEGRNRLVIYDKGGLLFPPLSEFSFGLGRQVGTAAVGVRRRLGVGGGPVGFGVFLVEEVGVIFDPGVEVGFDGAVVGDEVVLLFVGEGFPLVGSAEILFDDDLLFVVGEVEVFELLVLDLRGEYKGGDVGVWQSEEFDDGELGELWFGEFVVRVVADELFDGLFEFLLLDFFWIWKTWRRVRRRGAGVPAIPPCRRR
mmetsp:Transcript_37642/g.120749  ORF Transcript_37642/g.120749 Transcript_37642/m.120749 type:complete len:207 (+) Transcript_37642:305-925(+)